MLAETWRAINKVDSTNMQAFIFACFLLMTGRLPITA